MDFDTDDGNDRNHSGDQRGGGVYLGWVAGKPAYRAGIFSVAQRIYSNGIRFGVAEMSGNDSTVADVIVGLAGHTVDAVDAADVRFRDDLDLQICDLSFVLGVQC